MKRSTIIAAALFMTLAPLASASMPIMKDAKAKNPAVKYECKTCHTGMPATAKNLTPEGDKWIIKKK